MNSSQWFEKARGFIPGGVNSPVRSFKHVGGNPVYFDRGEGPYLYDVEGKRYTDFCLSFGPHVLGHSHPKIVGAIREQAGKATSFGACHPLEVQLAEKILSSYPFFQRLRLVNSGTEACMTAIRLARGYTGRAKVLKFEGCYHGHSDGLLAKAGSGVAELSESSSKGVPASLVADTVSCRLDRPEEIEEAFRVHGSELAAVILEPIPANWGLWVPPRAQMQRLFALSKQHGALVIFDEVITGFRLGLAGACGYFDLQPDLVTLGKIIGGGLPLAAVIGRAEILDCLAPVGEVYQAGTLSGNPLACAAGLAVIDELTTNSPYPAFEFACTTFVEGLKAILKPPFQIRHVGPMFWLHFGDESAEFPPPITTESAKTYVSFFKKALDAGVYFPPSPYEVAFLSTAHTNDTLSDTLERLGKALA